MNKRWEFSPVDEKKSQLLEKNLHISSMFAQILTRRNLDVESAKVFLNPEQIPYHDPFLLKDMDIACKRIIKAMKDKERICIYGDYDVDGVSSTALLVLVFSSLGFKVDYYLPDRHSEGYGLHIDSLDKLIPKYDLLITVDCGITALEEVSYLKDKLDIIITDHHLPRENLPNALAVVNPHREDCTYPFKDLCGVGVAFKLCQGLFKTLGKNVDELEAYLDIVSLGTVADIVPLLDENRRIVKKGLANVNNIGIKELLAICGYENTSLNTGHIGFGIAPRLNAAGRLTHASNAVELLITKDSKVANEKGLYLDSENKKRQEIVEDIFNQAVMKIEDENLAKEKVIIVIGENWHEGVIGITASRLQEKYYRPIIIIALHDDIGKASCRSIDGFHLKNALDFCQKDFVVYGGHSKAAGFTIEKNKIADFIEHMKAYAKENLKEEYLSPIFNVEAVLSPKDITMEFIEELSQLEPFGMKNARPQLVCQNLYVAQARTMGRENTHLRFTFEKDNVKYTAVGWNMADFVEEISYKNIDMVFQPELNQWNDRTYIQFKLVDLRLSDNKIGYLEKYPSYDDIGRVFLALRKKSNLIKSNTLAVEDILQFARKDYNLPISFYSLKESLKILQEINLLAFLDEENILLKAVPKEKIDIKISPTFNKRFEVQKL